MIAPPSHVSAIAGKLAHFLNAGSVRTVCVAGHRLPPPLGFLVRFPRMSLTLRGSDNMEIEQDGRLVILARRRGEAVFVPPNAWNRPLWTQRVEVLHFLFGPRHIGVSLVEHDGSPAEPTHVQKTSLPAEGGVVREILNALTLLSGEESAAPVAPLLVNALLHSLSRSLQTLPAARGRKARNTYDKVCLYLQEYFQRELTRESVAAQFHLNPNHLSRLFRREGLMRFTDYLAWVRVERAKYLLKHHDLALDDLAPRCGFRDTAYFCRVFKQRTNQTPTAYRLEARTTRIVKP